MPFQKGHKINLGKGKPHNMKQKHYPKMSEARRGMKLSKKHRENMSKARRGSKSYSWKGGRTSLQVLIRNCFKYRQWRSDVFTRDDFTCQLCGRRGVYLEANHYPKQFAQILDEYKIKTIEEALACEEFWNINNGQTLCRKCHRPLNKGRFKKHTKDI